MQPRAPAGIIGLGLMGSALAKRLIDAKISVIGFDLDASRCEACAAVIEAIRQPAPTTEAIR